MTKERFYLSNRAVELLKADFQQLFPCQGKAVASRDIFFVPGSLLAMDSNRVIFRTMPVMRD